MGIVDGCIEPVVKETPETPRPIVTFLKRYSPYALILATVLAPIQYHSYKVSAANLKTDQIVYDGVEDLLGRELVSIPWNLDSNPDVKRAQQAIGEFGQANGVDLVPLKCVHVQTTPDSEEGCTLRPEVDLDKTKATFEAVIENLESGDGWMSDRMERAAHSTARSFSGGAYGKTPTPGESGIKLEKILDKVARNTSQQPETNGLGG